MANVKRFFALTLVLVSLVSTMALPAFAEANTTWQNAFADFPVLYQGHSSKGYIKLLQRFLYCYSDDTKAALTKGGGVGVDGGFGQKTEEAVKIFQTDFLYTSDPLDVDGRPGENTWRKIAQQLDDSMSGLFRVRNKNDFLYYNVMAYTGATASTSMYNYTAAGAKETGCFDTINLYEYAG